MPTGQEVEGSKLHPLSLVSIVVGIAVIVIVAIFFRPGAFSVGQGASIKLNFADSRVDLSELLDKLLQQAGSGADAEQKRRLVLSILQAHQFYFVPSVEAVTAIRAIEETETTRDVARAVRTMLYDLVGPFARPATFLEAPDDRLLLAIDDLYERNSVSPIITKLWEMSLDFKGIFELRNIRVSVQEDPSLPSGVAATCVGNIWLGKVGLISIDDEGGPTIGPRIEVAKACGASGGEPPAEKKLRVWLSPTDMDHLIGNQTSGIGRKETTGTGANETSMIAKELHAILTPLPKNLEPETGRQ